MADIVVGVDGSPNSVEALRWAHAEAGVRGGHLVALFAWGFVPPGHPGDGHAFDVGYGSGQADAALAAAIVEALGPDAAGPVERRVVCGPAAGELLAAGVGAELVVVGARGVGGVRGLLLGSVSRRLLHQTRGPLAIVRSPTTGPSGAGRPGRIVVGFDGSDSAGRALGWAADEARRRHAHLDVLRAYRVLYPAAAPLAGYPAEVDAVADEARTELDLALAGLDQSGLPTLVTGHLVSGAAAPAILDAAGDADLVVLGTHGRGAVAGALVGSVTHHVAHHARVPMVVVP